MNNPTKQPTAIEYGLSEQERTLRKSVALEVIRGIRVVDELEDGYAFRYPNSQAWASRLKEFSTFEQRCFPYFTFERVFEPDQGPIWLQVRGPKEAKEFIKNVLMQPDLRVPPSLINRAIQRGARRYRELTSQIRVLPDFIIIGAAKCGTTSLYDNLTQHPSVAPALKKEIFFFDQNFRRDVAWYRAHFPTVLSKYYAKHVHRQDFVTGEATPRYIFHPHAPQRVFELVPTVKLIVLLRNPVDRAYSFYHQQVRHGYEMFSFGDAVEQEQERLCGDREKMLADEHYVSFNFQYYPYLSEGIYVDGLKAWMRFFRREQMLVLKGEDFYRHPSTIFKQVTDFLSLPGWEPKAYQKRNDAFYPKMETTTRERLIDYFKPHNQRLYEFLGADLGWDR